MNTYACNKCSHKVSTIQWTWRPSSTCPFGVDVPEGSAISLLSLLSGSSWEIAQKMTFPHIWIHVLELTLGSRPIISTSPYASWVWVAKMAWSVNVFPLSECSNCSLFTQSFKSQIVGLTSSYLFPPNDLVHGLVISQLESFVVLLFESSVDKVASVFNESVCAHWSPQVSTVESWAPQWKLRDWLNWFGVEL